MISVSRQSSSAGCTLFPFANEMDLVYAAADLVIARAGALSLAEITACGLPAILVPYPFAAGDHQKKNDDDLGDVVTHGVGENFIDEKELANYDLLDEACRLMTTEKYQHMKNAIAQETAGKKPAVDMIAEDIIAQLAALTNTEDELEHRPNG